MFTDKPNYGNTFSVAMWVVGTVLAVQALAVAWVMVSREPGPRGAAISRTATSPDAEQAEKPPVAGALLNQPTTLAGVPELPLPGSETSVRAVEEPLEAPGPEPVVVSPEPSQVPAMGGLVTTAPAGRGAAASGDTTGDRRDAPDAEPHPGSPTIPGAGDQKALVEELRRAALTVPQVEDRLLGTLILVGEGHLENNNMAEAFGAFREVEKALPDHPRVLGALGASFVQMGQPDKAAPYWDKLLAMGPAAAGEYFLMAGHQTGRIVEPSPAPLSVADGGAAFLGPHSHTAGTGQPAAAAGVVKIGEVAVDEKKTPDQGQQVSLRIVIDSISTAAVVVDHLEVVVQFYDLVNELSVDQSTAATSWLYPTEPYDWKVNGTEEVVVTYTQPVFTEEERRDLGNRKYHGYVIELYYNHQLQDRVAMPEDLAGLRPGAGGQSQGVAPAPASKGPDNALFPEF